MHPGFKRGRKDMTVIAENVAQIVSLLGLAEKLKCTMRHSWTSDGRHESVAEHTWRMSLMAMLVSKYLDKEIDELRILRMIIVHDLVEAISGDVPAFDVINDSEKKQRKQQSERESMQKIRSMLPLGLGQEVEALWNEFEAAESYEAKVAVALDKLEAQMQHNEADISTWLEVERGMTFRLGKFTAFDSFLDTFRRHIENDGAEKLMSAGFDISGYRTP